MKLYGEEDCFILTIFQEKAACYIPIYLKYLSTQTCKLRKINYGM